MTPSHPLLQLGAPPDGAAWAAALLGSILALAIAWPRGRARAGAFASAHPHLLLTALALTAAALSIAYVQHYLRGGPRIIDATAYYLQGRSLLDGGVSFQVPTPSAPFRGRFLVPTPGGDPAAPSLGVLFPPGYPALLAAGFALGRPLWVGPILGAALVVATYGLALRLSGHRGVALLAAALGVVSAALRYHTADTMSHGLAALLFTIALWASLEPRAAPEETPPGAQPSGEPSTAPGKRPPAWTGVAPRGAGGGAGVGGAGVGRACLGGVCVGWLIATRPVTGVVCGAACAWLLARARSRSSCSAGRAPDRRTLLRGPLVHLAAFALACLPGLGLLLWQQLELTGHVLGSVQLRYYSLADGPPGCFGLGLGPRFGCHHEHGDVVARFGDAGFDVLWALRHTLHRFHHHALDFANWEPAWLLVPWALWRRRRDPRVVVLALAGLGVVVAYGAFYFPGNYPGGGARFYLELLPLEHAIVAWSSLGLWAGRWLLPTALLGFACHGSHSHLDLAAREGGRPMFEADVVTHALGPTQDGTLLFVTTDHGFNLGFDPALARRVAQRQASARIPNAPHCDLRPCPLLEAGETLVARATSPDLDRLLWERLGRPRAYEYRFHAQPRRAPEVVPLPWGAPARALPPSSIDTVRIDTVRIDTVRRDTVRRDVFPLRAEAEHDWPPLSVQGGWSRPSYPPVPCASGGRALSFEATGTPSSLRGELNVDTPGWYHIALGFVALPTDSSPRPGAGAGAHPRLLAAGQAVPFELPIAPPSASSGSPPGERALAQDPCPRVELPPLALPATTHWTLETGGRSLTLDYIEVLPASSP